MSNLKKTTVCVQGMHCASCDILVKNKFQEVENIQAVKADHATQQVEITYSGNLDKTQLNEKISEFGYQVVDTPAQAVGVKESLQKRLMDAGAIAIILFMLYVVAQELNILPQFSGFTTLTYSTVFVLGLVASTSTCMATSGALFLVTIGKLHKTDATKAEQILPALSFNVGRVLMYALGGYGLGYVGKTISYNPQTGSILALFVAIFMILIGLDMLKLISFSSLIPTALSKGIFERLQARFIKNPRQTAFFLGASTYWLPCGFTQTVQVYALGLADPIKSALMMTFFALGTVPALMAIGFASSLTQKSFYPMFSKVMGFIVFAIGLSYVTNSLNLYGIKVPTIETFNQTQQVQAALLPEIKDGFQIVKMSVNNAGYTPNHIKVRKDVPVKWIINGENVFGCQASLVSPKLNVQTIVKAGENVIEFTPKEKGPISFSCSMGMYNGAFEVVEG